MIILLSMADDDFAGEIGDPIIPNTIRRPDSTTPSDAESQQEDEEEKALKKQREINAQAQSDLIKQIHDSQEKWKTQGDALTKDINDTFAKIQATPQDQATPSMSDQYRQEMAKNAQDHGMGAVGSLFALVSMGALLFGRKRSWGATSGIYQGLGNAMTLYSQGKEEQAREQQAKTLKMISLMHQENSERVANKKEILAEKRLTVQQKMDLLKTHHEMFEEQHTQQKDEQSALTAESNMLAKQEQALASLRRLKYKYHQSTSEVLKSKDARSWAEYVRVASGGQLDPMRSDAELEAAEKMYPIDQYIKERHDVGKSDTSPGAKKGSEKGMSSLAPKTSPEEERRKKAKEFWGTQ